MLHAALSNLNLRKIDNLILLKIQKLKISKNAEFGCHIRYHLPHVADLSRLQSDDYLRGDIKSFVQQRGIILCNY